MENSRVHSCSLPLVKKLAYGVAAFVAVVVAILVGHYLYAIATGKRFTADQWSAAGGWVSGLGTLAAVVVALWQIKRARDDAADAKTEADARLTRELEAAEQRTLDEIEKVNASAKAEIDAAEERHRAQLAKSDELLANELDAQRRHHQVESLGPIWNAIAALEVPATSLQIAMQAVQWHQQALIPHDPGTPEYRAVRNDLNEAANALQREIQTFAPFMMTAEISFTSALMLVDEPNTLETVENSYQAFIDFRKAINAPVSQGAQRQTMDLSGIGPAKAALNRTRDPMVKAVRAHLTRSRQLRAFDQGPRQSD